MESTIVILNTVWILFHLTLIWRYLKSLLSFHQAQLSGLPKTEKVKKVGEEGGNKSNAV